MAVSDSPGVNTVPEEVQQEFIKKHAGSFVGSALCFGLSGDRPIYKLLYTITQEKWAIVNHMFITSICNIFLAKLLIIFFFAL